MRTPLAAENSDDDYAPTADELALDDGSMVPFPHELSMQLGLELLNVFDAHILVTNTVGSGELLKAVLQTRKFGIGICRTSTHKKCVLERLKDFVKMMHLVTLKGAPTKSADLLKYEMMLKARESR